MSFLASRRTRGNGGPPRPALPPRTRLRSGPGGGRGRRPEAAAPSPTPPSGPARRSRQAPAPARRGLGARSRPRPGPAYPGRCSPHTPPLAAPSGTSSAATRPQPSGPAWGAQAAGPGGGGGPCCPARLRQGPGEAPRARPTDRPLGWPGTRRARLPARPRAPSAPRRPAPPRRHSRLALSAPCAAPSRSCRKRRRPCPPGEGQPHSRPADGPGGPRLPEKGSREREREGAGALKGTAAASWLERAVSPAALARARAFPWPGGSVSQPYLLHV